MSHGRQSARGRVTDDTVNALRRRARKLARRGDYRKAACAMREVVALEGEARAWVRLGHLLIQARREAQAIDALKQGLFLHRRAGYDRRARTVANMILKLDPCEPSALRLLGSPLELAA